MNRLVIIGLDCFTPQWALEAWLEEMPNLKAITQRGIGARLHSTIPPITVPAWTAMMTSKDPGMLGVYGFRNRTSYEYDSLQVMNAKVIKARTVWNYLSRNRLKSLLMGIPQTYPPKPLNGIMISGFMTPSKDVTFTHPEGVRELLDQAAGGEYVIDVKDFRTDDKNALLESVKQMTAARFRAFRALQKADDFDFAMMVEMGPDRLQHGFWRFCDPTHRLYEAGNPYENVLHDYYVSIDEEIGRTMEAAGPDTSFMVVSDHGAKAMEGAICINEWLQQQGYLKLKEQPASMQRLTHDMIDWPNTTAWGEGGYYGRLFFNVAGREPQGRTSPDELESVQNEVKAGLENLGDEEGKPIGTRVLRPEEVYREVNNIPPDFIIYFGDLNWRSAGSVGGGSIHMRENDTGPDDANHLPDGIFAWDPGTDRTLRRAERYQIYDIAPSILRFFGLEVPEDMIGESII
ncbi:MAG: phosphodiesterase [Armatimonadetes bacterium]|nr:phosphodiesterase [Armatimonadota bacterium]NIM24422.1 phosphodiesterase [Armatimonadota bacterium]NIM68293.1 phosphodiesterase [Armatimonadota bacterium]NIM76697.1 phosphodiesterase [Armatimonadota bacterium]NIN06496.1 phosphodiesterase [Armatimonadota bacterium]